MIIEILIIYIKAKTIIWLLIKENKSFGKKFKNLDKTTGHISFNINFENTLKFIGFKFIKSPKDDYLFFFSMIV